jgi:hypothetical protein
MACIASVAAPNLTMEQARERAARVSEVTYGLTLELDGERPDFSGTITIGFELAEPGQDLRIDFAGGTVAAVSINGARAEVARREVRRRRRVQDRDLRAGRRLSPRAPRH